MNAIGRTYWAWGLGALLALGSWTHASAQAEVSPVAPPVAEPAPEKSDPGARLFMQKCAGCHTVGGGPLSGPDLKVVQTWPRQNVDPAILRMEKNVGKLKPEDVQVLAELMLAPDAAGRIADERKRVSMQEMAKLEPANAAVGEALFFGRKPLANRGLACAACHGVSGSGGTLAIDLTGSFAKLGQVPLMSTIEGVTFPLMQASYAAAPITKQEAIHLVKYLESAGAQPVAPRMALPLHAIGFVGAGLGLAGMSLGFRKRNRGVRAGLVRDAVRRSRS